MSKIQNQIFAGMAKTLKDPNFTGIFKKASGPENPVDYLLKCSAKLDAMGYTKSAIAALDAADEMVKEAVGSQIGYIASNGDVFCEKCGDDFAMTHPGEDGVPGAEIVAMDPLYPDSAGMEDSPECVMCEKPLTNKTDIVLESLQDEMVGITTFNPEFVDEYPTFFGQKWDNDGGSAYFITVEDRPNLIEKLEEQGLIVDDSKYKKNKVELYDGRLKNLEGDSESDKYHKDGNEFYFEDPDLSVDFGPDDEELKKQNRDWDDDFADDSELEEFIENGGAESTDSEPDDSISVEDLFANDKSILDELEQLDEDPNFQEIVEILQDPEVRKALHLEKKRHKIREEHEPLEIDFEEELAPETERAPRTERGLHPGAERIRHHSEDFEPIPETLRGLEDFSLIHAYKDMDRLINRYSNHNEFERLTKRAQVLNDCMYADDNSVEKWMKGHCFFYDTPEELAMAASEEFPEADGLLELAGEICGEMDFDQQVEFKNLVKKYWTPMDSSHDIAKFVCDKLGLDECPSWALKATREVIKHLEDEGDKENEEGFSDVRWSKDLRNLKEMSRGFGEGLSEDEVRDNLSDEIHDLKSDVGMADDDPFERELESWEGEKGDLPSWNSGKQRKLNSLTYGQLPSSDDFDILFNEEAGSDGKINFMGERLTDSETFAYLADVVRRFEEGEIDIESDEMQDASAILSQIGFEWI